VSYFCVFCYSKNHPKTPLKLPKIHTFLIFSGYLGKKHQPISKNSLYLQKYKVKIATLRGGYATLAGCHTSQRGVATCERVIETATIQQFNNLTI